MAVDPKSHKLYLSTANFGPPESSPDSLHARPKVIPGTFRVLVFGQ